jgi:hypothetical protein
MSEVSKTRGRIRNLANDRYSDFHGTTEVIRYEAAGITVPGTSLHTGIATFTVGPVVTTGDAAITAGNLRLGPINAFATTEPTQAMVFEAGTAPAGAITTSGGLFSSATVVRKIIADGTVSNVET